MKRIILAALAMSLALVSCKSRYVVDTRSLRPAADFIASDYTSGEVSAPSDAVDRATGLSAKLKTLSRDDNTRYHDARKIKPDVDPVVNDYVDRRDPTVGNQWKDIRLALGLQWTVDLAAMGYSDAAAVVTAMMKGAPTDG